MVVIEPTGAFDLWTIFVVLTFGSFWLAVLFMLLLFSIILAMGRVSAFSIIWFNIMFIVAMTIGYGYSLFTIAIFTLIILWFFFSWTSWMQRKGQ
jgi:hypothetical protein